MEGAPLETHVVEHELDRRVRLLCPLLTKANNILIALALPALALLAAWGAVPTLIARIMK